MADMNAGYISKNDFIEAKCVKEKKYHEGGELIDKLSLGSAS